MPTPEGLDVCRELGKQSAQDKSLVLQKVYPSLEPRWASSAGWVGYRPFRRNPLVRFDREVRENEIVTSFEVFGKCGIACLLFSSLLLLFGSLLLLFGSLSTLLLSL
jgi:hypothetical protein